MKTADPAGVVRAAFAVAFAPRERVDPAEWAEKYREVVGGATPGPWSFGRTPYLRGVLRACGHACVRQISVMKAEQVGGTEAMLNYLFFAIDQRPGDKLYIYPNQDVAREVNKRRTLPAMRACDRIAAKMGTQRGDQGNLTQVFSDGSVARFAGSNSDANIEIFSSRDVFIDELDRCVAGVVGKTRGRRKNYPDARLYCNGTPGAEGVGIDAEYADSDRCRWWTPCPECGVYHVRDDFAQVKWDYPEGKPFECDPDEVERSAWYACPACAHKISAHEHRRTSACGLWLPSGWEPRLVDELGPDVEHVIGAGDGDERYVYGWVRDGIPEGMCAVWTGAHTDRDSPPPPSSHAGFHIWGMMSTIVANPFGEVAKEFVQQRGSPTDDWATRRLGRASRLHGARVEHAELRKLCTPYADGGYRMGECPRGTLVLTLAVDIQADRAYCEVRGWGEHGRDTSLVWCEEVPINAEAGQMGALRDVLKMRFPMRDNPELSLPIGATAIDSGHWTEHVYDLCARLREERFHHVFAVKGEGSTQVLVPTREVVIGEQTGIERHKANRHPMLVFKVNYWKAAALGRIRGEEAALVGGLAESRETDAETAGPGRFMLPEDAPDEYLLQLTSEERIAKVANGQPVHVFVPRPGFGGRNHYWDCLCYNEGLAARMQIGRLTESAVEQIKARRRERVEGERRPEPTNRRPGLLGRSGRGMLDRRR